MANIFRNIPSVNQLLESPQLKKMVDKVNHQVVVDGVRTFIDDLKEKVQSTAEEIDIPSPAEMAERIADWLAKEDRPVLRPVINGTGILLHTGLGRAPLCKTAIEEIESMTAGYASVEIDLAVRTAQPARQRGGAHHLRAYGGRGGGRGQQQCCRYDDYVGINGGRPRGRCLARATDRDRWQLSAARSYGVQWL